MRRGVLWAVAMFTFTSPTWADEPSWVVPSAPPSAEPSGPDPDSAPSQNALREVEATRAPPPRRDLERRDAPFGARGQVAIFGSTSIGASHLTYESGANDTSARFEPTFAYFPLEHLAIGLALQVSYDDSTFFDASGNEFETSSTDLLAGPVVGYDLPLTRYVSFFPNVTAMFGVLDKRQRIVASVAGGGAGPELANAQGDVYAFVSAPLLFHPTQHFSFGFGPTLDHNFAKQGGTPDLANGQSSIYASLQVVGHWGGDLPPEERAAAPPRRYSSHLGTDHTCVLGNDLSLAGDWTSLPSSHSTEYSFQAGGTFGCFIAYGISLGGGGDVSVAHYSGTYATTGQAYATDSDAVSISSNVGYAWPIGNGFVFYPRATLGLGTASSKIRSGKSVNDDSNGFVTVGVVAPVDYEVAEHFFVGAGPYVQHDLAREDAYSQENRMTSFGASVEIGTWL